MWMVYSLYTNDLLSQEYKSVNSGNDDSNTFLDWVNVMYEFVFVWHPDKSD